MKKEIVLLIVTLAAAMVLTGCGGAQRDSANPAPEASTTPKMEIVAETPETEGAEATTTEPMTEATEETTATAMAEGPELTGHDNGAGGITYALFENEYVSVELPADWKVITESPVETDWMDGLGEGMTIDIDGVKMTKKQYEQLNAYYLEHSHFTDARVYSATFRGREAIVNEQYSTPNHKIDREICSTTENGTPFRIFFEVRDQGKTYDSFDFSDMDEVLNHVLDTIRFKQ